MYQSIRSVSSKERAHAFITGRIFMNTLSYYWENGFENQKDFFEGVGGSINVDALKRGGINSDFLNITCYDPLLRFDAYKYCNLCCFYRMDIDDFEGIVLPPKKIHEFGDYALIIHNTEAFIQRISKSINTHNNWRYYCGDVHYHKVSNSKIEKNKIKHTMELISTIPIEIDRLIQKDDLNSIRYKDCFIKTTRYSYQNEWRICLLRYPYDSSNYKLQVDDLSDIVECVKTDCLSNKLIADFNNGIPESIRKTRSNNYGNISRKEMNDIITNIDRKVYICVSVG